MDPSIFVQTKKTSHETQRSLQKFLEPERNPKVIYSNNSLEFGKACEDLSWNHCTSTPHRSETNGIAERAVRRVKEGTSAILLQSGLDEKWWADSMECYCYLRNVQDIVAEGKLLMKDSLENHLKSQQYFLEKWLNILPIFFKRPPARRLVCRSGVVVRVRKNAETRCGENRRPVRPSCQERNVGNAQIRTLFDRHKEQILAECRAEIRNTNSRLIMTEEVYEN